MTVKELIKELQSYPDDWTVAIGYEYGDYYNTIAVEEIGEIFGGRVESARCGMKLAEESMEENTHLIMGRF